MALTSPLLYDLGYLHDVWGHVLQATLLVPMMWPGVYAMAAPARKRGAKSASFISKCFEQGYPRECNSSAVR